MNVLRQQLCVSLLLFLVACKSPERGDGEEAVFRRSQEFFKLYLESDAPNARLALTREITMLENACIALAKERRATVLFLECARLYNLEKRVGDEERASRALLKANYWNLRRYELSAVQGNIDLEEFKSFTPEKLITLVESSDKYHTNGTGPKYCRKP